MSLVVSELEKSYPTPSGPLVVLKKINLTMNRGESVAIMGPSGSGKSTLLHILGTLDTPTGGKMTLEGIDPFSLSETAIAEFRNQRIGFVFQDHHLLPQCTVLENVLIPTLVKPKQPPKETETYAKQLLERVGLSERIHHRPAELSGGERQRAAFARALIHRPTLLLADEPTGNLDRTNAQRIGQLLLELHHQEQTILIVVTHSMDLAKEFPKRMEVQDGQLRTM